MSPSLRRLIAGCLPLAMWLCGCGQMITLRRVSVPIYPHVLTPTGQLICWNVVPGSPTSEVSLFGAGKTRGAVRLTGPGIFNAFVCGETFVSTRVLRDPQPKPHLYLYDLAYGSTRELAIRIPDLLGRLAGISQTERKCWSRTLRRAISLS